MMNDKLVATVVHKSLDSKTISYKGDWLQTLLIN